MQTVRYTKSCATQYKEQCQNTEPKENILALKTEDTNSESNEFEVIIDDESPPWWAKSINDKCIAINAKFFANGVDNT